MAYLAWLVKSSITLLVLRWTWEVESFSRRTPRLSTHSFWACRLSLAPLQHKGDEPFRAPHILLIPLAWMHLEDVLFLRAQAAGLRNPLSSVYEHSAAKAWISPGKNVLTPTLPGLNHNAY